MKKIIIFGLNKLSELMDYYIATDTSNEVVAFTVDDEYCNCDIFLGKPVVPFSKLLDLYPTDSYTILLTIGYTKMNSIREKKYKQIKSLGYELMNFIHSKAICFCEEMGDGNIILENCTIGPFVKMGNSNIIYPSTVIAHHSILKDFNFFSVGCAIAGDVKVENCCFFGVNCSIKDNVHILDYTLAGAGVYINKNTEKCGVYTPARAVKLDKNSLEIKI